MENCTKILDWDSNFFCKKVAKIDINVWDEDYLNSHLATYKALDFDLVYIFLSGEIFLPKSIQSLYNCHLVDCKMIYNTFIEKTEYNLSPSIVDYKGDASVLYDLALQAGVDSRYKSDPYFERDDFERLYKAWIDNSVQRAIADKIFVFQEQKSIHGFVTVKIRDNESSIGLIATDVRCRGAGIGSMLLSVVKKYAGDSNASCLNVATQKENTGACSFYEKNGFYLESQMNVYHAWLKK